MRIRAELKTCSKNVSLPNKYIVVAISVFCNANYSIMDLVLCNNSAYIQG